MSNVRKPYQTTTRARAALYLRECERAGREPTIAQMVRLGIGANRKSASRLLDHVIKLREFDALPELRACCK